jgi:hypothetical protein
MVLLKSRIERESLTVHKMIVLYCRLNHGNSELCSDCSYLNNYAMKRLDNCPFENEKPTCKNCPIHCYRANEKERMREIMKFSGPRMLMYHPYLAVMHLIDNKKSEKREKTKESMSEIHI